MILLIGLIVSSILVMAMLGNAQFYLNSRGRLHRRFNDKLFTVFASIFGLISVAIIIKNGEAIVDWLDHNALSANDSPAWSIILFLMLIGTIPTVYGGFLIDFAKETGKKKKRKHLENTI